MYPEHPGVPPEEYNTDAFKAPPFRNSETGMSMEEMEDLGIVTQQAREDLSARLRWDDEQKKQSQSSEKQLVGYYKKLMSDDEAEMAVKLENVSYWTHIGNGPKISREGVQEHYRYVSGRIVKYETIMDQELMEDSDKEAAEIARKARNVWIEIREGVDSNPWLISIVEDRD